MLSAHPDLTPVDIRDALLATSDQANSPDNDYGWGIVNAYDAVLYHGAAFSNKPVWQINDNNNLDVSIKVASQAGIPDDGVSLYYTVGNGSFTELQMNVDTVQDQWITTIPQQVGADTIRYFFSVQDRDDVVAVQPFNAPTLVFSYPEDPRVYSPRHDFVPESFALYQNYPNPFNPTTTIEFDLSRSERLNLDIYNILGQKVKSLIDDKSLRAGKYTYLWHGQDNNGNPAASGVYFYTLRMGNVSESKRMLLLR